jgi:hypothetical protein
MKNYYEVLGLHSSAPPEVIRAAYFALVRKYLSDSSDGSVDKIAMSEITDAYEFLSKSEKYKDYFDVPKSRKNEAPDALSEYQDQFPGYKIYAKDSFGDTLEVGGSEPDNEKDEFNDSDYSEWVFDEDKGEYVPPVSKGLEMMSHSNIEFGHKRFSSNLAHILIGVAGFAFLIGGFIFIVTFEVAVLKGIGFFIVIVGVAFMAIGINIQDSDDEEVEGDTREEDHYSEWVFDEGEGENVPPGFSKSSDTN